MQIDITQNDIDQGKAGDPQKCALALALKRILPTNTRISVCVRYMPTEKFTICLLYDDKRKNIFFSSQDEEIVVPLPTSINKWIKRFDRNKANRYHKSWWHKISKPISFNIDIPPEPQEEVWAEEEVLCNV